jgi:hypothetical protein
MKTTKFFALLVAVISLFLLVGCSLFNNDSDGNTPQTDLQLLRIETTEANGGYPGDYGAVSYVNRKNAKAVTTLAVKSTANQTANQIEEIESQTISLVAVIKNENRASFIDMVVYNSQTDKTVVYNEGNGAYQCSSETVYEDGMWVTNITFRVNVELTADNFYFEIKEIKFLRNNTDEKADLNTLDVRKKEFRFTTEYFDMTATARLNQTIEGFTCEGFWCDIDTEQGTVSLGFKGLSLDKLEPFKVDEFGDKFMAGEIIFPESVTLQYYHNRELKTGELKITNIFVEFYDEYGKLTHIKTNFYIESYNFLYGIEYVEGTKVCEIRDDYMYYIPSTCEEIYINRATHLSTPDVINYNGTIEDFNNIKGAQEFISRLESLGRTYTITCTNGKITNSRWP